MPMKTLKEGGQVNAEGRKMRNIWIYAEDHKILNLLKAHYEEKTLADLLNRVLAKAYEEVSLKDEKAEFPHDLSHYPTEVRQALTKEKKEEKTK